MLVRPLLGNLGHLAANFHIAVGIVGVQDSQGHARISSHAAVFLAAAGGIDQDIFAIIVAPSWGDLRVAAGHERNQICKGFLLEKVHEFLGNRLDHVSAPPQSGSECYHRTIPWPGISDDPTKPPAPRRAFLFSE